MEEAETPLPLHIGISYNLKKGVVADAEDFEAEYDSIETVDAIAAAIERAGCRATPIEADGAFVDRMKTESPDLVFNIAEGFGGRSREGQVPAILEFLHVPYSGSDPTALGMALDKALTKRYLGTFGIPTPACQVVRTPDEVLNAELTFPVIVKPNCEGSSKGISDVAVCSDEAQLRDALRRNFRLYHTEMLVERFVAGREFTVGLIGNGDDLHAFEPMEIEYIRAKGIERVYSYQVKRNYQKHISYRCPPDLPTEGIERMKALAVDAHRALGLCDFSRVDFRMDEAGEIYFIEINPLPGLAPGYSDYPMLADFNGVAYDDLVQGVLNAALRRYGMLTLKDRGQRHG